MNQMYLAVIIVGIIFTSSIVYITYHDLSVEARERVNDWSCNDLKWYIDKEQKKIIENIFNEQVKQEYASRCKK